MSMRVVAFVVVAVGLIVAGFGCGPSDEAIQDMVRQEVERQVAEIEVPPGAQGPQGEPGPAGPRGDVGTQGREGQRGEPGISGREGPRGDQGLPGREGPPGVPGAAGSQGERGDIGPMGPVGQAGRPAEIPKALELEELIVRIKDGGGYLKIVGGEEGRLAKIMWIDNRNGLTTTQMLGGSVDGLVLSESNGSGGGWTEFCIQDETAELC